MEGKVCSKCGEFKSYSEFHKDKWKKDGYYGQCKQCKKEYNESHKEELKEKKKKYADSHKEERKEYMKQYRDSHRKQN